MASRPLDQAPSANGFSYDPFSPASMRDPHAFYPALREDHPAYYMPRYDAWAISRYQDVWDGFMDAEHFSEAEAQIFSQEQLLVHNMGVAPTHRLEPLATFPHLDPPVHTRFRQAMAPPFLKGSVAKRAPMIERLIAETIDVLRTRGTFDLNLDFASHVAAGSMCALLGLPAADVPDVIRLVNLGVTRDPGRPGFTAAGGRAIGELVVRLVALVARRRRGEGEANRTIDALLAAQVADEPLTDALIAQNIVALLVGGIETLPKIVAGGLLELSRRPDQLAAVAADPDRNAAPAFEEMLRFSAPAQWFGRTVRKARTLAGAQLTPGQRVFLLVAAANRDPREFDAPDEFRWDRRVRRLLSFGVGPHFCIGIHLARLEGQLMIREFLKAFPRFEIDAAAGHREVSEFQVGWTSLPVRIA